MISEIDFKNISESENFKYAAKLDFFKQHEKLEFTPGLNIIFAPNGTGKSTLMQIMAQFTASEQGGISTITHTWLSYTIGYSDSKLKGLNVKHDGQSVLYTNPRDTVGLMGGAFDDDFFSEGLQETQLRESTGLTTMARMNKILNVLLGKTQMPEKIETRGHYKVEKLENHAKEMLAGSIPLGNRTILIDEPESGLAVHVQAKLWNIIEKSAKENNLQIIVATHSPFALTCDANFIELQPGYIDIAKNYIKETAQVLDLLDKIKEQEKNAQVTKTTKKKMK